MLGTISRNKFSKNFTNYKNTKNIVDLLDPTEDQKQMLNTLRITRGINKFIYMLMSCAKLIITINYALSFEHIYLFQIFAI